MDIGASFRKNREHDFNAYPIDDEDIGVVSSSGEKNLRRKSVMDGHEEDYDLKEGDGRENNDGGDEQIVGGSSRNCLVMTLLAIFGGAVVCFVVLPPNSRAILMSKTMMQQQQQGRGQEMLELAEQITTACGTSSLITGSTSSSCQELCREHMCCVEQDEEYSCRKDEAMDCAVYAGCEALVKDDLWQN